MRHRAFAVRAPTVHVEHGGSEGLPLVIAGRDNGRAAKDAVHIGANVGIAGKRLADIRRQVEADVLPIAARLVTGPNTAIALGACPAVERDDVRTHAGLMPIARGDVVGLFDAIQTKGIAGADPSDVGLKGRNAALLDLLLEVALEMPFLAIPGLKVRLRPKTGGNAMAVGIGREFAQIRNVGIDRRIALCLVVARDSIAVLAITRTITVVGKEPAERHVVVLIVIDDLLCGKLARELLGLEVLSIDGGAMAVQGLVGLGPIRHVIRGHTVLVLDGSLLVGWLASLCLPGLAGTLLGPAIAVVRIQMAEIEAVFRQQHGIAGDSEVAVENILRNGGSACAVRQEVVCVELVLIVRELGGIGIGVGKIVRTLGKGVTQNSVAIARPVERIGRSHAAVDPIIGVSDLDRLAPMSKAAVLGAAAEEALSLARRNALNGAVTEVERRRLAHDLLIFYKDLHLRRFLVELDGRRTGFDQICPIFVLNSRLGMRVGGIGVRLRLDMGDMIRLTRHRVLVKGSRRVDVITENAFLEERDATLYVGTVAALERHLYHVLGRALGCALDLRQRRGLNRRGKHQRKRRSGQNRGALHPIALENRIFAHVVSFPGDAN